ncbi:MAG: HEPN domain-containing protein [Salinivirgaceae bacterium]|nr:HEPN domain-containing protein [Salinivirgaceae bacterium]
MSFTIEGYKRDIERLVTDGDRLYYAMWLAFNPDSMKTMCETKEEFDEAKNTLPNFISEYQSWYSEAKVLVKQLLPERLEDFVRYYEKPKARKQINLESYRIEDCLQGIVMKNSRGEVIADPSSAITHYKQQLAIIKGLRKRFESSLYDIRLHLQAEMFDDELDAASYLLKSRFNRAAGAMAGVVLERHLKQVCINHDVKLPKKKHSTISDLNEALKQENIIDTADWRRIQLLGDIRNKCDHDKDVEPSKSEVNELIDGVKKITQTLF